jgi:hypothetical protein
MTETTGTTCPACGASGTGNFCFSCGAPLKDTVCPGCAAALSAGARFCRGCGRGVGAGGPTAAPSPAGQADRRPWIAAGAAMAGVLAIVLFTVARSEPGPPPPAAAAVDGGGGVAAPDISQLTPRERFDRLYQRVLGASQSGDEATVTRFTPMALAAYQMLDSVDTDARYHAAVLRVHTGDAEAARLLGDTIVAREPSHLFGYMAKGTSARWRNDTTALRQAYRSFLKHYEAEMKAGRPEYAEHKFSVEEFRKAAQRAP